MAKRNSTRRKARKPKIIEVQGRELSQGEYAVYRLKLSGRSSIISRAEKQAQSLALEDLDYAKRVVPTAKDRLRDIGRRGMDASLAASSISDFAFYNGGPKFTELTNAIIGHCAEKLEVVAAELRVLHTEIAREVSGEEVANG
jgi:hypothetical protein